MTEQIIFDQIMQKLDAAAIYGEYLKLKSSGRSFKALCPFHQEKTPSFTINSQNALWYCFGCGEGGNLFQFIMKVENLEFPQALEMLAQRAGVKLPRSPGEKKVFSQNQKMLDLMEEAAQFYQKALKADKLALSYLKEREIESKIVEKFCLGVTPPQRDALAKHLLARGFNQEEILRSGTGMISPGGDLVDYLKGRLIFPLTDFRGRVLGLAGRILGQGEPKYLNTPETILFKKGNLLYALSLARTALGKQDWALVVEGYMDAIALFQAGFINVVAAMGTSLTSAQARLLRRFCSKALLAFDADKAGQAAALRGIEIFDNVDLVVKILPLPLGEDPDSLLKKGGPEGFKKLYPQAKGVIEYQLDELSRRFDPSLPEEKAKFAREAALVLSRIKDPIKRDEYIKLFCETYKIREESFRRLKRPSASPLDGRKQPEKKRAITSLTLEEKLLTALLTNPEFISIAREMITPEELDSDWAGELFNLLLKSSKGKPITVSLYLQRLSDQAVTSRLTEWLLREDLPPFSRDDLEKLIIFIQKSNLKKELEKLKNKLELEARAGKRPDRDEKYKEIQRMLDKVTLLSQGRLSFDDEQYQEVKRLRRRLKGLL